MTNPSRHSEHPVPVDVGRTAAVALRAMLDGRNDHVTSAIEWYRGFCSGLQTQADSRVEAFIRREIIQRNAPDFGLSARIFETLGQAERERHER